MSNRLVLVDDMSPDIKYSGPWLTAQTTQLSTGTNGPPFQNTLHSVNVNASLSYSFSGSQIIVLGTSIMKYASGSQDQFEFWECFVDNISIGQNIYAEARTDSENSFVLCQSDLQDGPHVLSINVTVFHQQTSGFWFDQIQYLPSSDVPLDNSTVRVDSSDPAVQYSSGWTELEGIVNLTQTAGSTIKYQFFGVSLSWLGLVPSNFSLTPTSAIYSIDGQTPISFFVPALSDSNINAALPLYNQVFFKTESLSPGQHELIVTYQGNSGTAPLALDAFIVQNASATSALTSVPQASATSAASSSVPSSGSSSNPTSNLCSNKSPLVGTVIAGVVGGVIVFVLLLLLYFGRRNNRRRAQKLKEKNMYTNPKPFILSPHTYYTPQVPSLDPQLFSSGKFSRGRERASNAPTPSRTPSRSPGSSRPTSRPPSVIGTRIDHGTSYSAIQNTSTETIPVILLQPPTSAAQGQSGGDIEFLRHADSGVRMPHAQGNFLELPPVYTSG